MLISSNLTLCGISINRFKKKLRIIGVTRSDVTEAFAKGP